MVNIFYYVFILKLIYLHKNRLMIVAYLSFNGNAEEAFNFYKSALEGEITNMQRFGDSPNGVQMPDADKKKIMHIALEAPDNIINFTDANVQPLVRPRL
jgi:uncharacterized glyoxalase superfamily protein PhnB